MNCKSIKLKTKIIYQIIFNEKGIDENNSVFYICEKTTCLTYKTY